MFDISYFDYIASSELDNSQQTPSSLTTTTILPTNDDIPLSTLICIGNLYSGTLTVEELLCSIQDIQCCQRAADDQSGYKPQYDFTKQMLNNTDIEHNKYIPTNIPFKFESIDLKLSQFEFDVNGIFKYIPMDKYFSNVCDLNVNNNISNNNKHYFIRNPSYFKNPVTAAIFAQFALIYHSKILFQLREPIDRLFVADVNHNNELWFIYQDIEQYVKLLVNHLNNTAISNQEILSIYYQFYFSTKDTINFEIFNSFYCIHILYWLHEFDKVLTPKNTPNYFKIIQTRYVFNNLTTSIRNIYCWQTDCDGDLDKININMNIDDANKYDMEFGNAFNLVSRQDMFTIFKSCNQRLDVIVQKRPELVLGDWISWNNLY